MSNLSRESKQILAESVKSSYGGGLAGFSLFDGVVTTREDDTVTEEVAKNNAKDVVSTHVPLHTGHTGLKIQTLPMKEGFDVGTWILAPISCIAMGATSEVKNGMILFNQFGATTTGNQGRACFLSSLSYGAFIQLSFNVVNGQCIDISDQSIKESIHGTNSQHRIISSDIIPPIGFAEFTVQTQPVCTVELILPNSALDQNLEQALGSSSNATIYYFGATTEQSTISNMLSADSKGDLLWSRGNSFSEKLVTFKAVTTNDNSANSMVIDQGSFHFPSGVNNIIADTCISNEIFYYEGIATSISSPNGFTELAGCSPKGF